MTNIEKMLREGVSEESILKDIAAAKAKIAKEAADKAAKEKEAEKAKQRTADARKHFAIAMIDYLKTLDKDFGSFDDPDTLIKMIEEICVQTCETPRKKSSSSGLDDDLFDAFIKIFS